MRIWNILASTAMLTMLTGCATPHSPTVTVYTTPSAAMVNGTNGSGGQKSPAVFSYERQSLSRCLIIQGFTARWISGAIASTSPTLQLCGGFTNYNVTINRPAGVAGVEYDIEQAVLQQRIQDENAVALGNLIGITIGKSLR